MKAAIHPTYHNEVTFTCACGNSFKVGSTLPELHSEICSACHPFYTGKQKLIDATGTVDRFKKRSAQASKIKAEVKPKKPRKVRAEKK